MNVINEINMIRKKQFLCVQVTTDILFIDKGPDQNIKTYYLTFWCQLMNLPLERHMTKHCHVDFADASIMVTNLSQNRTDVLVIFPRINKT